MNDLPHIITEHPWSSAASRTAPSAALGMRGEFAYRIAERLSLVAAMPDGEDSAGRQKFRMMLPREVASRACGIADELVRQFEDRGWMMDLPAPKPAEKP